MGKLDSGLEGLWIVFPIKNVNLISTREPSSDFRFCFVSFFFFFDKDESEGS